MKSIFKSKTFWFNVLSVIAAVSGVIPVTPVTAAIAGVSNILLRTITNTAVSIPVINPNPTQSTPVPPAPVNGVNK